MNTLNSCPIFDHIANVQEMSSMYYVTPHTIYYWIDKGFVKAIYLGIWLIDLESAVKFRTPIKTLSHVREQNQTKK
jgi:hypothetical protein